MLALLFTRLNPFDPRTILLAKHAQHVVLVHFPIALFISAVAFDLAARWTKRRALADAAYYNLMFAAISTLPVLATGVLAWQFRLEGQRLKGLLLFHVVLAGVASALIWLVWWLHRRKRGKTDDAARHGFLIELVAVVVVAVTAHLGGFLSGVNGPG